jgi:CubicO group peptidase (beta-lactamase class C family)
VKRTLRLLLILAVVLAGLGLWKRDEITRLLAVNSLFEADRIVTNFSTMDRLFLTRPLSRGDGPVSPLPPGPPMALPVGAEAWIAARAVTALVVVKDGQLRHESWHLGTAPEDRRISWSMAKSLLSALFGILAAEGRMPDLDASLADIVPELRGSAYDGASVRDVLTMSSGVAFNEDYLDFNSDINRMGRVLALGGSMDGFAAGLQDRSAEPGTRWHYVSIDTHVLGMVIRAATGQEIAPLIEDRLLGPLGLEAAPYYLTDGEGTEFVLGGLNMTSRDYARFGAMIAAEGRWQGRQVVPADWIEVSATRQAPGGAGYGFQWWVPADALPGEVMAQGIYGQYIWIDRARDIVVVVNAADRGFEQDGVEAANLSMLRAIGEAAARP